MRNTVPLLTGGLRKGHHDGRSTLKGSHSMKSPVFKLLLFCLLAMGCRLKTAAPNTRAQLLGEWQFSDAPRTEYAEGADLGALDTAAVDVLRVLSPGLPLDVTLMFKRRTVRVKGYHGTARHKYFLGPDSSAVIGGHDILCYWLMVDETPYSLTIDSRPGYMRDRLGHPRNRCYEVLGAGPEEPTRI